MYSRNDFNASLSSSYQADANGLENRRTVADIAAYRREGTIVDQEKLNAFTFFEKCKICIAEGCWGIFPCCGKKKPYFVYDYERYIVFRFGRNAKAFGPGYIELLDEPNIDKIQAKIDIRETCYEIPALNVSTRDQIEIQIVGICFYEIYDPIKGVLNVAGADVDGHTQRLAREVSKNACESHTLQEIMENKQQLQQTMKEDCANQMIKYGVRIVRIEIKNLRMISDQYYDNTVTKQPTFLVT